MQAFPRHQLLGGNRGRHFASEPHLRIQVLHLSDAAPHRTSGEKLFSGYHGELLLVALEGACVVRTEDDELTLHPGDQALLRGGEPFRLVRSAAEGETLVELIWAPGPNPCRTCWENGDRYFGETAGEPDETTD